MLCFTVRCLSAIPNPYERPARRITAKASKFLDHALSLVRRYRRSSVLRRVVSITTGFADFHKALALLEASLGDIRWLLSDNPFDGGGVGGLVLSLPPIVSTDTVGAGGLILSLPPIASIDPILSWAWSCITTVQMAACPFDRLGATSLANLAIDSGHNKQIIIEEGRVPPLLALLRDGVASMDA